MVLRSSAVAGATSTGGAPGSAWVPARPPVVMPRIVPFSGLIERMPRRC
jgi:hypothetical protein